MRISSKAMAYGALALSLTGCSTVGSAIGGAIGGVNSGVSTAAGNAAAGAVAGNAPAPQPGAPGGPGGPGGPGMGAGAYSPQMMMSMANMMFTLSFNMGGYWVPGGDLTPGQSVTFEFSSNNHTQRMERAFLTKLPDGKEWWRVKWYSMDQKPDTLVFEAMFSADRSQLLRMRGKSPGQQPGEMPVQQGQGFYWREPTYLTQESLDGATVGTETVTTPAGSFSAKHIRYNVMGGGTWEWWTASVPGGVVKYVMSYGSNPVTQTLVAMGTNATTELGSY